MGVVTAVGADRVDRLDVSKQIFWNYVVTLLPLKHNPKAWIHWSAPNTMTLGGLVCMIVPTLLLLAFCLDVEVRVPLHHVGSVCVRDPEHGLRCRVLIVSRGHHDTNDSLHLGHSHSPLLNARSGAGGHRLRHPPNRRGQEGPHGRTL